MSDKQLWDDFIYAAKERDKHLAKIERLHHDRNNLLNENERLRAELAAVQEQEPVAWAATDESCRKVEALGFNQSKRFDTPLYAAPTPPSVPEGYEVVWSIKREGELRELRNRRAKQAEEFWYWQRDGGNELESLVCPVLISASDLRDLMAPPPPSIPDGWVLVPVEPTHRMVREGDRNASPQRIYAAMLAAAPKPEDGK